MLYVVATPIGNLRDLSLRAAETLRLCDVVVCEDTRVTIKLLKDYQVPPKPLISYYEEVQEARIPEIIALLKGDQKVALVTDSGMPGISDPGYKLVRAVVAANLPFTVLPGPSAVTTALILSGQPPDKFLFQGYPPESQGKRLATFKNIKEIQALESLTIIFYLSPYKFKKHLEDLQAVFGDIEIVLVREMTKIYEERWSGSISQALLKFAHPKGEFVLLFHF